MASGTRQNSSRPGIGVTGNDRTFSPSWFCICLSIWIAGGRALRISIRHPVNLEDIDALVISGGDDIHPSLYGGQESIEARYDTARDSLEQKYIKFALLTGKPLLGICRGYQLMNVTAGGSLYEDIRHMRIKTGNRNTILPSRAASIKIGSVLAAILKKKTIKINSLHHQAIDRVADDFVAVAKDEDQIIQAIESATGRLYLGVQWHPEYLFYLPASIRIFRWLLASARPGFAAH